MKKRFIITILILFTVFFAYKKISKFFNDNEIDENVFSVVKSQSNAMENWLVYVGASLILISVVGITMTLISPRFKKNKRKSAAKNENFENLYS